MYPLAWHFDFHSHKDIRINHAPDTAAAARTLKQNGIDEIITFAKGHDGFAYYPSAVGFPHPRMKGDAFGDIVKACKAEGVRVLAYVSFGIDGEGARHHPEWCQVGLKGPIVTEDWFISVCPFTPYLEESVLPMIAEILERYPVDGLFFDTMGALGVCYCDWCRKDFSRAHGREIPREPADDGWGLYGRFRHERGQALLARVGTFIRDRKPDAKVGFNQVGTVRFPEPTAAGVTCLTLDFTTSTPQSLQASFCSAYAATVPVPSDVMFTIFNQGWGDWSPRSPVALEQVAASIWARNSRPYAGDRLHPANRLDPISARAMRTLADVRRRMEPFYPAADSAMRPDILVLHGTSVMYAPDMSEYARSRAGIVPLEGAHRLLLDAGENFVICAEAFLARHLDAIRLAIVPEMKSVEPGTLGLLKSFVERGGRLLVVGQVPAADGRPADWLGIMRDAQPWQDHIYLPAWNASADPGLPASGGAVGDQGPVLVRGEFRKLALAGAKPELPAIQPYDCRFGLRFGWGIGPADDKPSDWPALTRYALKQGEVWYLEAPIFSDYAENGNWTQIAWFRELMGRLVPKAVARVRSESGAVEVVAHAAPTSTWAFLVNHGGEQLTGQRRWSRVWAPLPPFPVTLTLRDPRQRKPGTVTANGRPVPWTLRDGAVDVRLVMDDIWRVVRVDWA